MIDVIDNVGTPILPEPSYEEASERKIVEHNGVKYLATYYPSMGGYAGKCLVRLSAELNGCIDCCVWHDGFFPFSSTSVDPCDEAPRWIHHCNMDDFIFFANTVKSKLAEVLMESELDEINAQTQPQE